MEKIVILGGGESGVGSAILAQQKGFEVFLSDAAAIKDKYIAMLEEYNIPFEQQGHTPEKILDAALCVKSPGIPDSAKLVVALKERGVKVISEIEFAYRYCTARCIAITGSNGKTTTTTLIYNILKNGGYNVALAGNIGHSFALQVATAQFDWYVLELSSFQLDGMYEFKADIAVLTNITPDHLDRYNYSFDNYAQSKLRVVQNMDKNDTFIYCIDDSATKDRVLNRAAEFAMNSIPFSVKESLLYGAVISENGSIDINYGDVELILNPSKIQLMGVHNTYNIMAASLAAMAAGVDSEKIAEAVYSFGGVEHRMEMVVNHNGVLFINDSKATNVDSTYYALEGVTSPTIWIAGGTDKGNDYTPLIPLAKDKVRILICMGLDNSKLMEAFTGIVPFIYSTSSLDEAMLRVKTIIKSGDTVLLSPCCASFDLFNNYEDRGVKFKDAVAALISK